MVALATADTAVTASTTLTSITGLSLPVVANAPTLVNSAYSGGSFSASFQTEAGFSYRVQYKDDLNAADWTDLTTINGDGTIKPVLDAASGSRFYRVITP